jgi:hypothetical protein
MSIMQQVFGGLMGNQSAAPAPAPTQVAPGSIPANGGAADPGNPMVPAGTVDATTVEASPLAEFADLWQPDPNAKPDAPMFGNVDPTKLMEAAKKTNFAANIPKELLAAISQGGPSGMEAAIAAMNGMSQQVYANSAMATTKIVEQALAKQAETFKASLPQIIKQHTLSDTLRSENPALSNPAVQPFIKAMETQLAVKHPGATASELTAMAKQYVEGIGTLFSPAAKPTAAETAQAGETDWTKFF